MSVGALTSFLSYVNQYTKPFNEITSVITELQNAFACIARIFDLLEEESEISDDGLLEIKDIDGRVAIDNVSFSYDKSKKLIEDFNLKVTHGQKVDGRSVAECLGAIRGIRKLHAEGHVDLVLDLQEIGGLVLNPDAAGKQRE